MFRIKYCMKVKKALSIALRILPFLLIAAILCCLLLYPRGETVSKENKRVVRVWNVDTFEGGKGSRTAFLRNAARITEKKRGGVYYLITSYTLDGATAAFEKGESPDMLSFGIGLSAYAENSLPLSRKFAGGNTESGCLAYPWCRGSYYLFSLSEDFSASGETVISKGGNNLSEVAAAYAGIIGSFAESTAAYVEFLNGHYRYLLGTQRDECRFSARGVTVYSQELPEYCDLYQYISVLSREKREDCDAFVDTLLSNDVQTTLSRIGMYPVNGGNAKRTVSVFSDRESLRKLAESASGGIAGNFLDKYLKFI